MNSEFKLCRAQDESLVCFLHDGHPGAHMFSDPLTASQILLDWQLAESKYRIRENDFWRAAFMAAIRLPPIESSDPWLATDVVNEAGVVADAAVAEAKKRGRLG